MKDALLGEEADSSERKVSPIGIKEPGMIGVMEPVSGEGNGHPGGVKNGWI